MEKPLAGAADTERECFGTRSCGDGAFSYLLLLSCVWMLSFAGFALPPELRTEAPRDGRRSFSGGGVGGKLLRLVGGSDCCLRDWMPGLTRFVAAKDKFSVGRSSLASVLA